MRYRTEIVIPPDRYVCVQLPAYFAEGKAILTVFYPDRDESAPGPHPEQDPDRQDIEWWEEFGEERPPSTGAMQ